MKSSKINKLLREQIKELEALNKLKDERILCLEKQVVDHFIQKLVSLPTQGQPIPLILTSCQHEFEPQYGVGDFLQAPRCKKCGAMGLSPTVFGNFCGVQGDCRSVQPGPGSAAYTGPRRA